MLNRIPGVGRFATGPSNNLHFAVGFACLLLLFCAPFAHSQTKQKADDMSRFEIQATRIMKLYDRNENGYLSKSEIANVQTPMKEPRFDLNGDKRLSHSEIVAAISRNSAAKIEAAVRESRGDEIARHVRAMIQRFDTNKNGVIDKREFEKVPNKETWTDFNEDKRISQAEMTRSLTEEVERLAEELKKGTDPEAKVMYLKFLDAAMKKNDLNGDGQLDDEEIKKGTWSGPIRSFDTNKDGFLSRNEMKARYAKMFNADLSEEEVGGENQDGSQVAQGGLEEALHGIMGYGDDSGQLIGGLLGSASKNLMGPTGLLIDKRSIGRPKTGNKENPQLTFFFLDHRKSTDAVRILNDVFGLETDKAKIQQAQMAKMMARISGSGRSSSRTSIESSLKFGDDPTFNAVYVVGATDSELDQINGMIDLIDRELPLGKIAKQTKTSQSKTNQAIEVKLFLLRAPINASSAMLAKAVESIEESKPAGISGTVAQAAKHLGIKKYDKLKFRTVYLAKTAFDNSTFFARDEDSRIRNSRSRGTFESQVGNALEMRFSGDILATANEGFTKLQVDVEKLDFTTVSEDSDEKPIQFNLRLDTSLAVYPDKPTVMTTVSADQNWIIVATVK